MKIPVAVFGATLFIAAVGFADDVNSIPVVPRLLLQGLRSPRWSLPRPTTCGSFRPARSGSSAACLLLAGLWFVNLVNFMDGLDLMTVAEIVPLTGALVLLGWLAELPAPATVAAAALFGAMLGFAPFNRPVAKIFLGDVGSLPIGLLAGWCLLQLAWHQQIAAALLLPLYYLADATVTLLRRMVRREPFWAAHRTHFYQRATDNGFAVWRVVSEVFALNVLLAALAIGSVMTSSSAIATLLFVTGGIATALLMYRFSRRQRRQANPAAFAKARGSGCNSRSWRSSKSNRPGDFGCALGPLRIFGAGGATDRFRELIGAAGFDDPADIVLGHRQRRLGVGFGNQDHRPADRQQIVEPAGHRYAGDVPAVGNDPDIGGGKKRLQLFILDAIDQGDVRKLCLGLHRLQLVEANSPTREQEVDIRVVPQQARRLEHDDGIMGKAEIA